MKINHIISTVVISSFGIILSLSSCDKNSTPSTAVDCSTIASMFSQNILPIYTASCATSVACHAAGSKEGPGALITYAQIVANKTKSYSEITKGTMPPGAPLSVDQKNKIYCWMQGGAQNN